MNWYFKNMDNLLIGVAVIMMFLMIVDIILGRKSVTESGKWPLFVGLAPSIICLFGLIMTLPVLFSAREIFVAIISPGSPSVWLGWVYAAKIIFAFLLAAPFLSILGMVFMAKTGLPHTWIF